MRSSSVTCSLLLLALVRCGSKEDLVLGEIKGDGGTATPSGMGGASGAAGNGLGGAAGRAGDAAGGSAAGGVGADAAAGAANDCLDLESTMIAGLRNRYSFEGNGDVAVDSVSGAHGEVMGTTLDGSGVVTMDGEARRYVDLPNGIISSLTSVSIVTWMTWTGGAAYQRIFDFGVSSDGEGLGSAGRSYLALMPMTGFEDQAKPGVGAEIKAPGFDTVTLASNEDMKGRFAQVALVLDGGARASLYLDGALLATDATAITPADIDDRNDWIGQSQYETDPFFHGNVDELRIYDVSLSACQIHALWVRGPQSL